jgi:hypothetical protein
MILWLDATSPNAVSESLGKVGTWYDWSGNSKHVTQDATVQKPTYTDSTIFGEKAVVFDGNVLAATNKADYNFLHDGSDYTIFVYYA